MASNASIHYVLFLCLSALQILSCLIVFGLVSGLSNVNGYACVASDNGQNEGVCNFLYVTNAISMFCVFVTTCVLYKRNHVIQSFNAVLMACTCVVLCVCAWISTIGTIAANLVEYPRESFRIALLVFTWTNVSAELVKIFLHTIIMFVRSTVHHPNPEFVICE